MIYEFDLEKPGRMTRQSMENYPFTQCYDHCWLSNRPFEGGKEDERMWLIHMYRPIENGVEWVTARFIRKDLRGNLPQRHGQGKVSAGPCSV